MRTAYEAGAEYVVIFNYAEDMGGTYGTLQDEHFVALEQFWNDVVQSSSVKHGSVEAEVVLVLPENYGWGMRNPEDTIWGIWGPDEKSQQIWELSRNLLEQYGLGLDIVYDDSEFPVEGKYGQIFYWNQTIVSGDARSLIKTSDGGFALAGSKSSFGGGDDFWIVKTDVYGNEEWSQTHGGSEGDIAYSLFETSDGGYALAGSTSSFGAGETDLWLVKTNEQGLIPEFLHGLFYQYS